MITIETIRGRREQLAAQREQAMRQAAKLEQMLMQLRLNIAGMTGGLQELDALLESPEAGLALLLNAPPAP